MANCAVFGADGGQIGSPDFENGTPDFAFSCELEDSPRASRGRQTRRRLGRVVWRFGHLGSVATISAPHLPTARRSRGYLPNVVSRVSGR